MVCGRDARGQKIKCVYVCVCVWNIDTTSTLSVLLFVRQSCIHKMHMQMSLGDQERVAGRASLFTRSNVSLQLTSFFAGLPRSLVHLVSFCHTKKRIQEVRSCHNLFGDKP